jgi:hypothetical protein
MLEMVAAIIGCITGVASLFGIVWLLAYWKGGIDAWRKAHEEEHRKYPAGELALMVKTMWDIYVVGPLHDRPDLATHQSPFKLTETGASLIPDEIKAELCEVKKNPMDPEAVATGWLVVKNLGMDRIEALAKDKSLSVPETIAILSTYLENHTNHC